ncbi:hypothetical protein [Nocardia bovistercoris]|uniref:Uncharacterized protein n=1 Tax=Nocardia bovistercoris TaxID=2785916 RepID=A0A931I9K5_9NOCA|nr:hypothetical protein [Nocardia bovistercoris]MBH0776581.1 hypothetical protein [Nocardia bovistercoris]
MNGGRDIPKLTVTMLGTGGSGKTSFLMGMYGAMANGVDGYFVHTPVRADHIDLLGAWRKLLDSGSYPLPNDMKGLKFYEFVLDLGFSGTIMEVDWLDYRGGALSDRNQAADTAALEERLAQSDSIYIVLDGAKLGAWMSAKMDGDADRPAALQEDLGTGTINGYIMRAVHARRQLGRPLPSLVVLITKEDLLVAATRLSRAGALQAVEAQLRTLLRVAFAPDTRALVNPTTLDAVGGQDGMDRSFKAPFIFTFTEYLRSAIAAEHQFLEAATAQRQRNADEIRLLETRLRGLFRPGRKGELSAEQRQIVAKAELHKANLEAMRTQAATLEAELAGLRIYDSGEPRGAW